MSILKIILVPLSLILSLFVWLCAGLLSCSGFVFKLASGLLSLLAFAVMITYSVKNGIMGISFSVHWLGTLLTGIVISRGSNYASDLIKRLQNPDIGEIVLEDIVEAADPANKAAVHISGVPPNA